MREESSNAAKNAALETGKLLLDHFQTSDRKGFLKSDRTMVTEADLAADKKIQDLILAEFPSDQILSEEGSTIFPENEHVWVIDPLDGTVNFSRGLQYWGVSIAHLKNGLPSTAALFFPSSNELFTAVEGGGAELNGTPLKVAEGSEKDMFPLFLHCSRMHKHYQADLPYKKRSLGSAAYQLCLISKNTAILAFESTVKIWDFAAAWLVIKEAGGVIESFDDRIPFPAQPGTDYQKIPFSLAAGATQAVLDLAREKIIRR